jgi:amidase
MSTSQHWKDLVADKRKRQLESIPKEWIIPLPPAEAFDVTGIPDTCGLLSEREREITNTVDVSILLHKLAHGEYSAVEVTTAYYKRAVVAHQLVRPLHCALFT